jgi:hypothetical protein
LTGTRRNIKEENSERRNAIKMKITGKKQVGKEEPTD